MNLLGLSFILYYIKLSDGNGFWSNIRRSDPDCYRRAVEFERIRKKLKKAELDLKFLYDCRDEDLHPKFTRWRNFNTLDDRAKHRAYRKVLNDEIKAKHAHIKRLRSTDAQKENALLSSTTWMKSLILTNAINGSVNSLMLKAKKTHKKKFINLMEDKRKRDGIIKNPNQCIINLSGMSLSDDQYKALQYGLKYGIATNPKESDLMASAESFWEQLERNNLLPDSHHKIQRAKNVLRGTVFNFLNFHDRRVMSDNKKTKCIQELCKEHVILQPDKGGGIVLMKKTDYRKQMEELFSDRTKFKIVSKDPTPTRLNSLQKYLKKLQKRGEISDEVFKTLRPKNAKSARAHGLPKTHKRYVNLPPFRPVIDTIGTTHSQIGKYLCEILKPLSTNEFTLKDSFDAADRIRNISPTDFENGYQFVSFDVVSLFTNVPLKRTLNLILDHVYKDKQIETTMKRSTLKKLILDTCTKTAFSFNDQLYEQTDGVSMGGSLGPLLANIIMVELESKVIRPLINDGTIKFYTRFVDDTLLLLKEDDIERVKSELEKFDSNLKFTYDKFEDETPHFLDIEITSNGLRIYRKETFTGHYTDFSSFVPWSYRISWIRSLVYRTKRLCDREHLKEGIQNIKKFASWNGFPRSVSNRLISRFVNSSPNQNTNSEEDTDAIVLWFNVPYIGSTGEHLIKSFRKKIINLMNTNKKIKIRTFFKTTSLKDFASSKDKVPLLSKSNVVYEVCCPGCGENYIGKTERTVRERSIEHAWSDTESPMRNHLRSCPHFNHLYDILTIFEESSAEEESMKRRNFTIQSLQEHIKIIDNDRSWNHLLYKEALNIERKDPGLNKGLKASRQLKLFR